MKIETYRLPAHWASTLVNGDSTGNTDEDDDAIDGWYADHPHLGCCLSCDGEPEFRKYHDAPGVLACDVLEFSFPVLE